MTYSPDMAAVRDAALASIAEDDAAGRLTPGRGRGWHHDEPQTEADAARWLDAHPDDPGPTPEAESRAEFEDAGADRYDPDDVFDRPDGLCPGRDGVL